MNITNIETAAFETMMARFEAFVDKVDTICCDNDEKRLKKWLDKSEVCDILNVSMRTLQNYRDTGMIGFSKVGHKIFYRPQDVEALILKLKRR